METTTSKEIHKELIEDCKTGSHSAFEALYNLYAKAMYNVALRIIKEEEEAHDILQEAFIKAYEKINQYEYQATFGAWLKRIVINQALDLIRKKNRHPTESMEHFEIAEETQIDWNILELKVETIKRAILQLPDGFRMVATLYLFEGYEHKEIAEILGISENTSKSQFHRAKIKLKQLIGSHE